MACLRSHHILTTLFSHVLDSTQERYGLLTLTASNTSFVDLECADPTGGIDLFTNLLVDTLCMLTKCTSYTDFLVHEALHGIM